MSLSKLFVGENSEQYNVLMTALEKCSEEGEKYIYDYLETTPKTSLVVEIVDKIIELGFNIKLTTKSE